MKCVINIRKRVINIRKCVINIRKRVINIRKCVTNIRKAVINIIKIKIWKYSLIGEKYQDTFLIALESDMVTGLTLK